MHGSPLRIALLTLLAPLAVASPLSFGCSATSDHASERDVSVHRSEVASGLLGLNMDPEFGKPGEAGHASLDQLRYLGMNRVRIHPKLGDRDFSTLTKDYKGVVKTYRDAGIHVLVVINEETVGSPVGKDTRIGDWAHGDPAGWAKFEATFVERAGDLSAALGDGVAYEVWNEPDDGWGHDSGEGHFSGDLKSKHLYPAQFADLVTKTTKEIHARSGAQVLSGGLSSGQASYMDHMGPFEADGVAIHFYNIWSGDELDAAPGGGWFQTMKFNVDQYHQRAGSRRLYLTEWGTQNHDYNAAAALVSTFFANVPGGLEEAYFFAWCECQDTTTPVQSLTSDGHTAHVDLWQAWRSGAGADDSITLGGRCLPDPSQSCDKEGDPGCALGNNLVCENGGGECGGVGPTTSDCNHCCLAKVDAPQPPPPPPPPPPGCSCAGQDDNGMDVSTKNCGDSVCAGGREWVCEDDSGLYHDHGSSPSCTTDPPPPPPPHCECYLTDSAGNDFSSMTCDETLCADGKEWICEDDSGAYHEHADELGCGG